ncbi:Ionotropic receptor 75a [Frankliniella fusca]|uniref:Ionotropic receptor 75a n=1 Tax=Frankliniella fusca TaxID=407009 RepID=A0AAE1H2L6_9NEOP|nr:Ionotropic receptor 75a [Frankliniella fusca]
MDVANQNVVLVYCTCFIFRHPRLLVPYKALSEPFAPATWAAVALAVAASCGVLAAVRRWETARTDRGAGALSEAAVVVVGILSQQGSALDSRLVSGRAVLLSGLLLSVMLQSFYTSAIVTSLLTPIPRTIRTVHDLMRSPLKVGLEDYSYNRAVFPSSADPLTAQLYRSKILPAWPGGGFFTVSDGVERVRRGGFAFYSEDSSLYTPIQNTFSDDEKCSLSEVELNPAFVTAATLARRSPYKELFNRGRSSGPVGYPNENYAGDLPVTSGRPPGDLPAVGRRLLLMLERGLRARQRRQWSARRPSCERETEAVAAVGLDPIFPAHALLLVGTLAALGMLYGERRGGAPWPPAPTRSEVREGSFTPPNKLSEYTL